MRGRKDTSVIDVKRSAIWTVTARGMAMLCLVLAGAALAARLLDAEQASTSAVKVVTATIAMGVVPGVLLTLLFPPRPMLSLLEAAGFGMALSFGVVHLLTIVAVTVHLSPGFVLGVTGLASVLAAAQVAWRSSVSIGVTADELIVLGLVVLLGVPLYLQGSPFDMYEDQVLAAIVRRLSELETPRLDNLYVAPGIVYTYPFPSLLYFMGLVARLGDIDPLFLYHKLRFFWGPAALLMLYLAARAVFGYASVACGVALTALVLVCAGVFGMVESFPAWWGQLVPYTYVPDVAMTVLLPALLVVAFEFLQAKTPREGRFFLTATSMLVLMLTVVHIREIVQFAAYVGCFVVVTALVGSFRPYLRRAVTLLVLTLSVAAGYTAWQSRVVPVVGGIVEEHRAKLVSIVAETSWRALLFTPASDVFPDFLQDFDQIFTGVTPLLLFGGVLVLALFRQRPLMWFVASSSVAYLLVMSLPVLAAPYIYLTYFEILHIPVRNVIFFLYLSAGALIYCTVVALSRFDRTRMSLLMTGALGGALALLVTLTLNRSLEGFFLPLLAAYALAFLYLRVSPTRHGLTLRGVGVVLTGVATLGALWPERVPVPRSDQVTIRWAAGLPAQEREGLEKTFSLANAERKSDTPADEPAWNYRLQDLSSANVRRIVEHPRVADTHFIDRSTFTVARQPPPGDDHPWGVAYVDWLQYPGPALFAGTALLVWGLGLLAPFVVASPQGERAMTALRDALAQPFYSRAVPFALFIVPFTLWSVRPGLSPLMLAPMKPAGLVDTPGEMIAGLPCVTTPPMPARFAEEDVVLPERTSCPPDYDLMAWLRTQVPVDAVFAIDRWTPYPPQMFMPQQAVVFPTLDASFINEDALFHEYYRLFGERMARYRVQPFFNAAETPEERDAFVAALGVSHVLVSPVHYDELRPVLDALPDRYALKYDQSRWAVYEARRILR